MARVTLDPPAESFANDQIPEHLDVCGPLPPHRATVGSSIEYVRSYTNLNNVSFIYEKLIFKNNCLFIIGRSIQFSHFGRFWKVCSASSNSSFWLFENRF
jgi:hypothetical protein